MSDILPYVELLDDSESAYQYVKDALLVWADCPGVTQAFCVMSAGMMNGGKLRRLNEDVDNLVVHGGYKTAGTIDKFRQPKTTFDVMHNHTPEPLKPFFWECETAVEFITEHCEYPECSVIDKALTDQLLRGTRGQAWMYCVEVFPPTDGCATATEKSIHLVGTIRDAFYASPRIKWVVGYWAKPNTATGNTVALMVSLVGRDNMIPFANVRVAPNMSDPKRTWGVEEIATKIYANDYAGGSTAVIFTGYSNFAAVAAEWHRITHQTQGAQQMAITSRAIRAKHPMNIKKMLISGPVAPPPAYLEVPHLTWANTTNGGGGQPAYLRQVGNKCVCRVMFPIQPEPYLCIPQIAVGTLYGTHGWEGCNGHDSQAMGAAFSDELAPLTIHKRTMCEPKMIGPAEMGIWLDFEIPMLAYSEPEAIVSVNLLLCRVLG
jgi:hypothetical protein